jgi:hypothetical protein
MGQTVVGCGLPRRAFRLRRTSRSKLGIEMPCFHALEMLAFTISGSGAQVDLVEARW